MTNKQNKGIEEIIGEFFYVYTHPPKDREGEDEVFEHLERIIEQAISQAKQEERETCKEKLAHLENFYKKLVKTERELAKQEQIERDIGIVEKEMHDFLSGMGGGLEKQTDWALKDVLQTLRSQLKEDKEV